MDACLHAHHKVLPDWLSVMIYLLLLSAFISLFCLIAEFVFMSSLLLVCFVSSQFHCEKSCLESLHVSADTFVVLECVSCIDMVADSCWHGLSEFSV